MWYCWWKKYCTSWQGGYLKICRIYLKWCMISSISRDYRIAFEWVFWQHTTSDSRRIATNATQRCKTWTTASNVFPKPIGHLDREPLMAKRRCLSCPKAFFLFDFKITDLERGEEKSTTRWLGEATEKKLWIDQSICGWVETPTISRVWSTDLMYLVVADSILSDQISECLRYF